MIASRRRGQVSLTTVLWLLLMLVAQAYALRGIGLLLAASFHDEPDKSNMDAGRRGLIPSVQAEHSSASTTSSSSSSSSSSSLSSSSSIAAAAAAAGKAQTHGAGAGQIHRPAPPAAAYHEHTHPSSTPSPAAEKDAGSFNQLDPGASPGHIDCPPLDASSSSSSSSEDDLVDCNSPSPEGEIDPRYGVEKRFVPTGPNPLHN